MITQENYQEQMEQIVEPYLAARKTDGYVDMGKGDQIYYERYLADAPKAVLMLVHGFSETPDKYHEVVYNFLQRGCHVWTVAQREHGLSARSVDNPDLVNVKDCFQLVKDLHALVQQKVIADPVAEGLPRYLFGHSMGGGVSACYIGTYPEDFDKAVLSSPMLEMKSNVPTWAAAIFARTMLLRGKGEMGLPGAQPFSGEPDFAGSASVCEPRYLYWFARQKEKRENQMCIATINSAWQFLRLTKRDTSPKHCARVKIPVLLCQADNDTFVGAKGQEKFIRQIPNGKLVHFDGTKHEIYLSTDEILDKYWNEIDTFLGLTEGETDGI